MWLPRLLPTGNAAHGGGSLPGWSCCLITTHAPCPPISASHNVSSYHIILLLPPTFGSSAASSQYLPKLACTFPKEEEKPSIYVTKYGDRTGKHVRQRLQVRTGRRRLREVSAGTRGGAAVTRVPISVPTSSQGTRCDGDAHSCSPRTTATRRTGHDHLVRTGSSPLREGPLTPQRDRRHPGEGRPAVVPIP